MGAQGFLFDRDTVITVIRNSRMSFPTKAQGLLSIFALTDVASGVCESGLKYSLHDAMLQNMYPLGISNEFIGQPSQLSVKEGALIVIYPQNATPVIVERVDS
jgi:thiamine pyrophosphokinase